MRWSLGGDRSTHASSSRILLSDQQTPRDEKGNSSSSHDVLTSKTVPTLRRLDAVLKDEEKYQALQYPDVEDVPGCMRLL